MTPREAWGKAFKVGREHERGGTITEPSVGQRAALQPCWVTADGQGLQGMGNSCLGHWSGLQGMGCLGLWHWFGFGSH